MAAVPEALRVALDRVFQPQLHTHVETDEVHTVDGRQELHHVYTPLRPGRVLSTGCVCIGPPDASQELKDACVVYVRQRLHAPWLRVLDVETIQVSPQPHAPATSTAVVAYLTAREGAVAPGAARAGAIDTERTCNGALLDILIQNALAHRGIGAEERQLAARYPL